MSKEIFKDLRGYEGLYQIGNKGSIYSLITNRFIKHNKHKCGYLKYSLSKDGQMKTFLAHRLVASNFVPNPNNLPQVNHIDGNKLNNDFSNLEWCTKQYNTKHAFDNNLGNFRERALSNIKKINEETSYKKIILKKGNELYEFSSVSKAADFFQLKRDNITRAIRKGQKVAGFEVWGYRLANEESL